MAFVESCPSPSSYTSEAAIVAAQSCAVQAERLEDIAASAQLMWWAGFALVGLTLVLLIVPFWIRAWGFERKLAS